MMVFRSPMEKILEQQENETIITNPKEPVRTFFRGVTFFARAGRFLATAFRTGGTFFLLVGFFAGAVFFLLAVFFAAAFLAGAAFFLPAAFFSVALVTAAVFLRAAVFFAVVSGFLPVAFFRATFLVAAAFFRALQETKRPHIFVWGQSGHGQRARTRPGHRQA